MRSSYAVNNYAEVFRAIVSAYQPTLCVELGVLDGYSACAIAEGLRDNHRKFGSSGRLDCYDLFEDYPYNHSTQSEAQGNIGALGLDEFVKIHKGDAFLAHEQYQAHSVHFLHVDLSNDGQVVRKIMSAWDDKMVQGGIICFEGGSEERDECDWMQKYDKPSIKVELDNNVIIEARYIFATYFKFPSLTCLLKKR